MGSVARIVSAGKALAGVGLAVGAVGVWALAPRPEAARRLQGALGLPQACYAHRGLHDAGSGLEADPSKDDAGEREYVALARRIVGGDGARRVSGHKAVPRGLADRSPRGAGARRTSQSEAVTQELALVGLNPDAAHARSADGTAAGLGVDPEAGGGPAAQAPLAPENSLPAFAAACQAGYGIELDVRLTKDKQVVVVHDDDLRRVAGDQRKVADLTYAQLREVTLGPAPVASNASVGSSPMRATGHRYHARHAGRSEPIHVPLLSDVLALVDGRVPILVEYKMGSALDWELMERTDALLSAYPGPYLIESFNPLALAWYRRHRPTVCRGQLAVPYHGKVRSSADLARALAGNLLLDWLGRPDFAAYEWHGGAAPPLRLFRALGGESVAWTLRSAEAQSQSRANFDRFIFESYVPARPLPLAGPR
ncbi:glycerophosphoryl diester phosphodiesterase [Bifidobacterium actinocoloniiforme DSM 22766]|uniref:Glycerophosphoryl diester phosphodiesterase n=1 Tax=Bifidobacterium actinocoloniiforme DSM 22766 TaxID=1437605 RepID=A0A086Z2D0_9BIFI|nr:glycerophosphodiester phosphodiesterase family protein [Bifidobacterium actinocoloniiforme]AKV55687.1 hypothetical protein AB656_05250 [Bifidobacterium actinocoloniiforme DSM 22766]KFI40680.1 glycerophosphoryl diester phosphodiesterase [Bifidobacterium actinocoloniiforme DSM 22766]